MGKKKKKKDIDLHKEDVLDFIDSIEDDFDIFGMDTKDNGFLARRIRDDAKATASVESVASFPHNELKLALSYFKIPNRSFATTKTKMAQLLVSWVGGSGHSNEIQLMLSTLTVQDENELHEYLEKKGCYDDKS